MFRVPPENGRPSGKLRQKPMNMDLVNRTEVESQEKTYQTYTETAARGEIPKKLESDQVSADSQVITSRELKKSGRNDPVFAMMACLALLIALLSINGFAYFISDLPSLLASFRVKCFHDAKNNFLSYVVSVVAFGDLRLSLWTKILRLLGDCVWLKKFLSGDFGDIKSIKSRSSDMFEMGVKYLHHRAFAHGRLMSRNCVVDGRLVLKVTDYGFNDILETLRLSQEETSVDELWWMAPELLFVIIMQEVMVRGTPLCMMDLPARVYHIRVSHSTVTILQALNEGREVELQGRTELRV
ncbi:Retinal Guanylyl Cyclase 2 [Manis pentadactyla]|nr:Retinal Guanylyl Cyclase 2 [Manis pentadactyla]